MRDAHFHLRTAPVSRSRGHSAVAAAAYQANQQLTHHGQRQFSISIEHRKLLNKGVITDTLQQELSASGITLSNHATAEKQGRRLWTITDGANHYTVKEFAERKTNQETGKREVTQRVLDIYADRLHDYTSKEDVKETWLQLPAHAPDWIVSMANRDVIEKTERQALWNAVESAETARDGRAARKFEISLVRELSYDQNKALMQEYIAEQFTNKGLIADVAVHTKQASDGLPNVHVHILVTTREIGADGEFVKTKNAYWNKRERVSEWRIAWASKLNGALEENGSGVRADHRSYELRGIEKTPQEHMGYEAWHLEQKGMETDKGNRNREIRHENAVREIVQGTNENGHANAYEQSEEREWEQSKVVDALSSYTDVDANGYATQHNHTLRQYIRTTTFRTLQTNAEWITRVKAYSRTLMDKAREMGRNVFDRFASWTEREANVQLTKQRTKGHER